MNEEWKIISTYTVDDAIEDGTHKDVPEMEGRVEKPRFRLGRVVATNGAIQALEENKKNGAEYLARHVSGDWGELGKEDKEENELSVKEGFRILSAYKLPDGQKLWIITEADRSATTLLLPSEY